jgi:hypothetical protein
VEIQIKTLTRYYFMPIHMVSIKRTENNKC